MSLETPNATTADPAARPAWLRAATHLENGVVVAALAVMVVLPCLEVALRATFKTGVPASAPIVQHLVLVVGMLGGALAARDGRLLSLSTLTHFLKGRWLLIANVFSSAVAAGISGFLCLASFDYVRVMKAQGKVLAFGVPTWPVQSLLVIGFALVGLRLLWHAGAGWRPRLSAALLCAGLAALVVWLPVPAESWRWPAFVLLGGAILAGAPVFAALGGAALILFWTNGDPISSIPLKHYQLTVNPTLPSIPLFTLAGYFLAEGGAARRFVRLFQAAFGHIRGGPAIVAVLVCAFFTSFTGASGVTILALGGLLLPVLVAAGYPERKSLGILTGAGSLGLLFPPCLPPILYSIVASSSGGESVRMEEMFQGGLLPGVLMMGMAAAWGVYCGPRRAAAEARFDAHEVWRALRESKWELLIPVVALVFLFSGIASPVEAAAVTALYAFVVETFVYRDLRLMKDVPRVMRECGLLMGGVLLILGVALGFTHYLIDSQMPDRGVEWVTAAIHSKWTFLLALNLFLIVVGCLMDIYSAIVVVVPLMVPIARAFGVDPIHLGVIFLANLELGFLTPPVGMNLFLSSYRFNRPMPEVTRATLPMLTVLAAGVLLITYVPALSTWLPGLFRH